MGFILKRVGCPGASALKESFVYKLYPSKIHPFVGFILQRFIILSNLPLLSSLDYVLHPVKSRLLMCFPPKSVICGYTSPLEKSPIQMFYPKKIMCLNASPLEEMCSGCQVLPSLR